MNPAFTLSYPEFTLANQLQYYFPKSKGFSIFVPISQQEKAIDLLLVQKRSRGKSRVITFQVKASRSFTPRPVNKPRTTKFNYYTWFSNFAVQEEADYYLLFAVYFIHRDGHEMGAMRELRDLTLLFTNREMADFLKSVAIKAGTPDKMFAFGFNDEEKIVQTRGNPVKRDFTRFLLRNRIVKLRRQFGVQ